MTTNQSRAKVLEWLGKPNELDFSMFEMTITSAPVIARARSIRMNFAHEDEQELQAEVDPSAEELMAKVLRDMVP